MHIEINNRTTLRQIQEVFSDFYPWLWIDFYNKAHKKYEGSESNHLLYAENTVGDLIKSLVSGTLEILPRYKVGDVEREFQRRFGLSAQILMKDKDQWVQTVSADNISLKDLNQLSRHASDDDLAQNSEEAGDNFPD